MATTTETGIAIVGCGYVADAYRQCLPLHQGTLRLAGAYDRDPERLAAYRATWGDRAYASLDELLADPSVSIVLNLTDPESHAAVTEAAIAAGKHVYSEKPLAMTATEAAALRDRARAGGVRLASAPCNLLGESVQTAWAAIREGRIGKVLLAYAELDDGMIHRANYGDWRSRSGKPWPGRGEFETGCTYEHAGYALTVFAALFGPATRVTSFAALLVPDKDTTPPLAHPAPDFSVGCIEFESGVVARLTNSIVAPYDHRMRIIGETGTIEIKEPWDYASPVILRRPGEGRIARLIERRLGGGLGKRLPMARPVPFKGGRGKPTMDFLRGPAELAEAIRDGRPSRLDEDFAVHVTEVTEMLQYPERFDRPVLVKSRFAPIRPMDWAT
ncbi:oxidoreductase [Kaistia sp. 32K]|uniref:Gfo/Idh/MocA family protein n=1 Tax=Kaistia sp. 32K TaxID=2795690 RepID=UPI001915413D|nr:Gfo/Idh/MocA family oxidoreductase [Kaistia sp. 32K]BCP51462.1 oxidoreductase [Kaistia sp. 32K]